MALTPFSASLFRLILRNERRSALENVLLYGKLARSHGRQEKRVTFGATEQAGATAGERPPHLRKQVGHRVLIRLSDAALAVEAKANSRASHEHINSGHEDLSNERLCVTCQHLIPRPSRTGLGVVFVALVVFLRHGVMGRVNDVVRLAAEARSSNDPGSMIPTPRLESVARASAAPHAAAAPLGELGGRRDDFSPILNERSRAGGDSICPA